MNYSKLNGFKAMYYLTVLASVSAEVKRSAGCTLLEAACAPPLKPEPLFPDSISLPSIFTRTYATALDDPTPKMID